LTICFSSWMDINSNGRQGKRIDARARSDVMNFDEFFNKRSFHSTEQDRSKSRTQAIFHCVRQSTRNALPLRLNSDIVWGNHEIPIGDRRRVADKKRGLKWNWERCFFVDKLA